MPALVEAWTDGWGVYLAAALGHPLPERRDRMDPEVVAPMEAGLALDAAAFKCIDAWRSPAGAFSRFDALPAPTPAVPAPPADGWTSLDEEGRPRGFEMTSPFDMLGRCPALSVPSGTAREGPPTGVRIVAQPFDDATAPRRGAAVEALRTRRARSHPAPAEERGAGRSPHRSSPGTP